MRIRRVETAPWTPRREAPGPGRPGPAAGQSPTAASFVFALGDQVWWPCAECGGAELPVRFHNGGDVLLPRPFGHQQCPGCETRRRRSESSRDEPAVWYDTRLCDWVVRVPVGDAAAAAVLPLEIRWFDAPWAEVYRAAGDLLYGHDEQDDIAAAERPWVSGD